MSRLIDADALYEYILRSVTNWSEDREIALDCIANSPTIEERKKGMWIEVTDHEIPIVCKCSVCEWRTKDYDWFSYCPNCGAEMEESTATNSTTDGDNSTTQKSVNKTEVNE